MVTSNWPPAGTYTWPSAGTFPWPRTTCLCRDGSRPLKLGCASPPGLQAAYPAS